MDGCNRPARRQGAAPGTISAGVATAAAWMTEPEGLNMVLLSSPGIQQAHMQIRLLGDTNCPQEVFLWHKLLL